MATTTIPWGDGSGDNIYLTYSASQGDQTVLVSSDANGGPARTKDITFVSTVGNISRTLTVLQESGMDYVSITWNDTCITYDDTAIAYPYVEQYIVFVDSDVETICANTWGDGVGLKPSHAAAVTNSQFTTQFRDNAQITSFDEFQYFTGLTQIYGNNSSSTPGAFGNCTSLESITFGPNIRVLNHYAFYNCTSLEEVTISRSFSSTYVGVWTNCTALKRFNIPSISVWLDCTLSSYHPFAASGEGHLYIGSSEVTTVTIPSTTEEIKGYAFYNCVDITSITIPSSVTSIGGYAFSGCSGLTGTITIPSSVSTIGQSAFSRCSGITKAIVNSTQARILYLFQYCTNLQEVELGGSVTKILGLFRSCSSLTTVTYNNAIDHTEGTYNYMDCSSMSRINLKNIDCWLNSTFNRADNHPSYSSSGIHLYINNVEVTSITISSLTTISSYLFRRCVGLTNITINSQITAIGDYAFDGCSGLTSVSIPSSVTSIGQYAFYRCSGISGTLTIPSTVTTIGNYAFQGLSSITNAVFNGDTSSNVWMYGGIGIYFGNGTGTLTINGDLTLASYGSCAMFLHYNITGDFIKQNSGGYGVLLRDNGAFKPLTIRIGGNIDTVGGAIFYYGANFNNFEFIEVGGTINNTWLSTSSSITANCIMHLGYNGIAGTAANCAASAGWITKIYVGDGSSAAHDDAILAQYTADTDWSAYSSKLDTWYNYINDPNANPDYIN